MFCPTHILTRSLIWTATASQVKRSPLYPSLIKTHGSDVFLVCNEGSSSNKVYQIWKNSGDAGFSLASEGSFPSGLQSVSFADMSELHGPDIELEFLTGNRS